MTVELIELLLGVYFVGVSITVSGRLPNYTKTIDWFKLFLGAILIALSLLQGVSFI